MKRNKRALIAILLMLSIGNFTRLYESGKIRTVEFLSIFAIGALSALLVRELAKLFRERRSS